MIEDGLATAEAALDRAQSASPHLDAAALTDATKALCAYRDELRCDLASLGATARLRTVNALISLVHAVHFPIGGVPWGLLEEARAQFKTLSDTSPRG